eukprot:1675171-Pyramimonas_sp.AAC.1
MTSAELRSLGGYASALNPCVAGVSRSRHCWPSTRALRLVAHLQKVAWMTDGVGGHSRSSAWHMPCPTSHAVTRAWNAIPTG